MRWQLITCHKPAACDGYCGNHEPLNSLTSPQQWSCGHLTKSWPVVGVENCTGPFQEDSVFSV